jgi:hypothetical protein
MRKNVRQAMDALFAGKDYTNSSIQTRQCGELLTNAHSDKTADLRTVYSYGSHFPLVILGQGTAYVNQDKYSVTTSTQQSGVTAYLHYEGYRDTGQTIQHRGHTYAVYHKDEPESWPNYSTTGLYRRPNHHSARYEGPVYHADSRTYGPREKGR